MNEDWLDLADHFQNFGDIQAEILSVISTHVGIQIYPDSQLHVSCLPLFTKLFSARELELFEEYEWMTFDFFESLFTAKNGEFELLPKLSQSLKRLNLAHIYGVVEISLTAAHGKTRIHKDGKNLQTSISIPLVQPANSLLLWFEDGESVNFQAASDNFVRSIRLVDQLAKPRRSVTLNAPALINVSHFHQARNDSPFLRLFAIVRPYRNKHCFEIPFGEVVKMIRS